MKPLKLQFSGINSFSEHTIIDFESLTRSGIFGIFGDTGSGKSTILDAINFALYGKVERSKEKTDIINYRSDAAKVTFSFNIINDGKRKVYTVDRTLKKDKSGTHKAMLYEKDGEKEVCIADKATAVESKITEILGVDAEDFRKCIALPQGEFAQFVKSMPAERLKLMERLFNLSRYGDRLKIKLNELLNEIEIKYQNAAGGLAAYASVTKHAAEELKAALDADLALEKELKLKEKAVTETHDRIKNLNGLRNELVTARESLSELEKRRTEVDELRAGLTTLEDCREAVRLDGEIRKKTETKALLISDRERLNEELEKAKKLIAEYDFQLKECDFDGEINKCVELAAKYAACEGKEEKLSALKRELEEKRVQYKALDESLKKAQSERDGLIAAVEKLQKEYDGRSGKEIEKIINEEFKGAVLREEYSKNLDWLLNFSGKVKCYSDDSPLYEYVQCETANKISEYTQRINDVRDFKMERVNERLKEYEIAEEERENLLKRLNSARERLQNTEATVKIKLSELENGKRDGKVLRERADEIVAELNGVFGQDCKDYAKAVSLNERKLKELKEKKSNLSLKAEQAVKRERELSIECEKLNTLCVASQTEISGLSERLEKLLAEKALGGVEKCRQNAAKYGDIPDARKSVEDYDARVLTLKSRCAELENIEGLQYATDEVLLSVQSERAVLSEKIAAVTGDIAVKKSECASMEKRLAEKKEIEKRVAQTERERNLAARLKEITKNNKFLEFIANEYLTDISSLASSTLLNLTGGRYFLTYKDNNFSVGDNFNCGSLRGVNTLSGGETFLVSLSLALALSQTICAKSQKSIEFFFLDEGFGTLDGSLLDTVMSALEKLKSTSFTIGVISHVEELKHRITNQITVKKATECHGSTVSVSC